MASASQSQGPYDVFLSFRGPETRHAIISHVYRDLDMRGINTFKDDEKLKKGEPVSPALIKAIEKSRIAVIIFTRDFASSSWCLKEVAKIMECKATNNLIVLPVFYYVDPNEVREGRKEYKAAFDEHKKRYGDDSQDVKDWEKALKEAGSLYGSELNVWAVTKETTLQLESREFGVEKIFRRGTSIKTGGQLQTEAELVESIAREIWIRLKPTPLAGAEFPVGIDCRVKELISKLNMKSQEEFLIIGLWSMEGMGKTTLARALYNSIFKDFEGSAYIDDIRETSQQSEKMVRLQKAVLSQMLMIKETSLTSDAAGSSLIAERLCRKRVLLILVGVDDICQINSLAKKHSFGKGSRIIITTTDKGLLNMIGACIHEVPRLSDDEACELFEKHAYKKKENNITGDLVNSPTKEKRENLVKEALQYTQGLPLALVELGRVFAESGEEEWESKLANFAKSSHHTVDKKLRISYDGLDDDNKDIFLHIACFFNGWSKRYVEGVLTKCGLPVSTGVKDLIRRSLIMEENGTLKVHDLIELMGKNIVDGECRHNAAKRSRLWRKEDVAYILSGDEGTADVTAIVLALPNPETINIRSGSFAKLTNLRFLIMINVETDLRDPIRLPRNLRWFEWPECPASSLILTSPNNLAVLAVRKHLFKEPEES